MKKLRIVLSLFIALLGVAHTCFTPVFYNKCDLFSLWFAATGLALVFMGGANYLMIGRGETWLKIGAAVANFGMLTILTMVAISLNHAPQAWLGVALALGLFVTGIIDCKKCNGCDAKPDQNGGNA
jgi:hypothetical protein